MSPKECYCGSGEYPHPLYDGYGIFLAYVCSECEAEKLGHYRPDIMYRYECDEPIEEEE